jgi:predicted transposase YdaD
MSKPDELWKKIIEDLFEDFIAFFMPDLFPHIDFSKGYTFIDKELHKIFSKSKGWKRYPDHLVKVYLKDGAERWILIHVEVQGYGQADFPMRMFTYFYRIFDKHRQPIVALCIFIDNNKGFKPERFEYEFYQTKVVYEYRIYKLLEQDENSLIESNNPFAMAALIGLYRLKSGRSNKKKLQLKIKLLKALLSKRFSPEKVERLFLFLDGLLALPERLEIAFEEECAQLTGGKETMGLTYLDGSYTRKIYLDGHAKGKIEGKIEGKTEGKIEGKIEVLREALRLQLIQKFGSEGLALMSIIEPITEVKRLYQLLVDVIQADNIANVKGLLQ